MQSPHIHPARGFTLIELLTVLSVAAVVLSLGLPAMQGLLADARRTAAVNALVGHIQLARGEAIRRGTPVVLCRTGGHGCAGTGGDWSSGWQVFIPADPARPAQGAHDAGLLVREQARLAGGYITANRQAFVFHADQRSTNGTLTVCDPRGPAHSRAVIVSYTGRPRISATAADGSLLPCP